MSNPFSVSYGQLGDALGQLQAQTQQLESIVQNVQQRAQSTLASWDGQAKDAYAAAQQKWTTAINDMVQRLSMKAAAGFSAMEQYQSADAASAGGFQG